MAPTIICLQEIQQNAYPPLLIQHLPTYPNRAIFPHIYAPKGGLGTFSQIPLIQQRFEPYPDRGLRFFITFADWALFKGVLITHLQTGGTDIFVLNTHLNANYSGDWHRKNPLALVQLSQIQKISALMEEMPAEALIILCGDFNFPRTSFLYKELVAQNRLIDPLFEDPRPTYRPFPLVPPSWKTSLDYILYRPPQGSDFNIQADILPMEDSKQKSTLKRFLTDHCALTLNIKWKSQNKSS